MSSALPSWLLRSWLGSLFMTLLMPLTLSMVCCFPITLSHSPKPKKPLCVFALCFHLTLVVVMEWANTLTAFVNAVCQGLRPRVSGCSAEMKALMAACWHANPSSRPCLSSPSFFTSHPCLFLLFCAQQHFVKLWRSSSHCPEPSLTEWPSRVVFLSVFSSQHCVLCFARE